MIYGTSASGWYTKRAVLRTKMGNFRVYRYTVRDVSMRSGNSERAVRRHAKEGRLDMEDIVSVGRYIELEGGRNGKATR